MILKNLNIEELKAPNLDRLTGSSLKNLKRELLLAPSMLGDNILSLSMTWVVMLWSKWSWPTFMKHAITYPIVIPFE